MRRLSGSLPRDFLDRPTRPTWAALDLRPGGGPAPDRLGLCRPGLCRVRAHHPGADGACARAVADHAARIPPTLVYARAQNNNHLLSEAAGLYTAGLALPDHPQAAHWRELGWKWLNHAFQRQIAADGTYTQHSTNYHRLMLQAALWVHALPAPGPSLAQRTLQASWLPRPRWLHALLDPHQRRRRPTWAPTTARTSCRSAPAPSPITARCQLQAARGFPGQC